MVSLEDVSYPHTVDILQRVVNFSQLFNSTAIAGKHLQLHVTGYICIENKEIFITSEIVYSGYFMVANQSTKMIKVFHLKQSAIYSTKHSKQLIHAQPNHTVIYTWL